MRFIILCCLLATGFSASARIPLSEREALIDLYEATQGDQWRLNFGWKDDEGNFRPHGTEHEWYGVSIDPEQRHVFSLFLNSNQLAGAIPDSLADLKQVRSVDFSRSQLSEFPLAVTKLPYLNTLRLLDAGLSGPLPTELGEVPTLRYLFLGENAFVGKVPDSFKQLTNLIRLSLQNNALSELPDLSDLSRLIALDVHQNLLNGPVPTWVLDIESLTDVNLSGNQFTGAVPGIFASPGRPLKLDLSDNQINHFPEAHWSPNMEIRLQDNLLTEADCDALNAAFDGGTRLVFFGQKTGRLHCNVMTLRQSLPWVSEIPLEWDSYALVYNPSSEHAFVQIAHPQQESLPLIDITPRSFRPVPLASLDTGYNVQVFSDNPSIFVSYSVRGQRSPSGRSPALTLGQRPEDGDSHLMFPVLPNVLKAAFAIHVAEGVGETLVDLKLHGTAGLLGTTSLVLTDDLSQALLIPSLFPDVNLTSHMALEVMGPPSATLHGTAFAFNDLNEPAMMSAIPYDQATSDWTIPWAASNDQFLSNVSVFNPGQDAALVSLQAIAPNGETREAEFTIEAGTLANFPTGDLFPDLRGYAVRVKGNSAVTDAPHKIFANIQIGNRENRPSGSSPALTRAVNPNHLTPVLAMPIPILADNPALVIQAPNQTQPVEVAIVQTALFGSSVVETIVLEGGRPKPILVEDLVSSFLNGPLLLSAVSVSGEPIAGTVFYFNEYREPSMTQGLSQNWFDLSVSLSYQPNLDKPLVVTIENEGPFTSPAGATVVLAVDDQEVSRQLLQPLGIGETRIIAIDADQLPVNGVMRELDAKLKIPPNLLDMDHENNRVTLRPQRTFAMASSYRLHASSGDILTGLLHADEDAFEAFVSQLILEPGDIISWRMERLAMSTQATFRDPEYRFGYTWQPVETAEVAWHAAENLLRITGLETSAVYRIHASIQPADGDKLDYPNLIGLSRSAYNKAHMEQFEQNEGVKASPRVYHPFEKRNWIASKLTLDSFATAFTGDEEEDGFTFQRLSSAIRQESEMDRVEDFVLELPEGLISLGFQTLNFTRQDKLADKLVQLKIQGAGKQKTFIADGTVAPVESSEGHYFYFSDRMRFIGYEALTLENFAFWGATPRQAPVMEVSGRPYFEFNGEIRRPYAWFAVGIGISNVGKVAINEIDLRFHSIGLSMGDIPVRSLDEETVNLRNLSIGYCDSALVMRDMGYARVGPNIDIHHVSSQGILGNKILNFIIEDAEIDGARHRGINLDRMSDVRVRNNTIRNSGQSGIHLGGDVHYAAITGNTIQTVDRDRHNSFGDMNSVDGSILSYRPLYEGIKSVRGRWGDSSHLLIAENQITDVANGIAIAQGNASDVLIEKNIIQAMQRGIRLEYGKSKLLVEDGLSFEGFLSNLFVMPDNQISLLDPVSEDNRQRHGILFPDADPDCLGCNIDFLESYGEDLGKSIAYYPFPIEFASYDACGDVRDETCREWQSNEAVMNVGPVYLPVLGETDYQHPSAQSVLLDDVAMALANELRQRILAPLP